MKTTNQTNNKIENLERNIELLRLMANSAVDRVVLIPIIQSMEEEVAELILLGDEYDEA